MFTTVHTITLLAGSAVALGAWALVRFGTKTLVVDEHSQVFVVRKGRRAGPISTGVHRFWGSEWKSYCFDTRAQDLQVSGQEMLTRDSVSVKWTALIRYTVIDGNKLLDSTDNWYGRLYYEVQTAMRTAVALFELDEVLESRSAVDEHLQGLLSVACEVAGLRLESARMQDLMLGGELKRAMMQVVEARVLGKAKLERARSETASLRSLANAARMLKEHAGLLDLRTLEVAEKAAASSSNTLVLGVDPKGIDRKS